MSDRRLKILFVAFPFSVHTARWISHLEGMGWEIHLFSSMPGKLPHNDIRNVIFHEQFYNIPRHYAGSFKPLSFSFLGWFRTVGLNSVFRKLLEVLGLEKKRSQSLEELIKRVKPDIIHSFETQHAGYLVTEAKSKYGGKFPVWIHSNWGIDIHFFGKLETHAQLIADLLRNIDVFIAEGSRDEDLARKFGFTGKVYTFPSVGGGFKIPGTHFVQPSARIKILVKGTQDIVRRGLVAIRALEKCIDLLDGYEIVLYSSNEITQAAAEMFYHHTGKRMHILGDVTQTEMLALNGQARLNICVNKSDGVPNAMLEAMLMGAFPIQSDTSMADEWLSHNKTGMIVPPEDPDIIEQSIRKALRDDDMVDRAATINRQIIKEKLEYNNIGRTIIAMYQAEAG